jgi:malate dehydrogenase (oxaloacetate-decarboxylating)
VSKILMEAGVSRIVGADSKGLVSTERPDYVDGSMNAVKRWYAEHTNRDGLTGPPVGALDGADLFIGLSGARIFAAEELRRMSDDAMVFAMANPTPEVSPEEAAHYARIVATGRSDYPNQINNVLCFPGIFRGALDVRAREISEDMKMAAARAIAAIIPDAELREDYIIPSVFNRDVAPAVARAVAEEARRSGEAAGEQNTIGFAAVDAQGRFSRAEGSGVGSA